MPRWPRVHPLSFPRFLISLFIKLNIEDYKGNQWHWNDTLKYFSNCDIRVSLLTTKSSIGPNNYHNFKAVMSINQFCHSVMPDSLRPHELQHTRPPCPSPSPRVYSNSCPLSWWCHPAISSSVVPFSSRLQSFPASGSFQMSQFFASSGQSIGVSAVMSVLPMNIQDWFLLGWTSWISLQSKGLSKVFSNTTVQKHQFFSTQLSLWSNSHNHTWLLEKP